LAEVAAGGWHRLSCGDGAKGPREYDWALIKTNVPDPAVRDRWLLIRRSVSDPGEVAYFACGGPPGTTLAELVRVAGTRWAIEECFEIGKGDCGLDEYEVRSWVGWHRHVTLSLFALAVRPGAGGGDSGAGREAEAAQKGGTGLVPLSVPEVRKLLLQLVWDQLTAAAQALAWSAWRRQHQHRARACHYRKRGVRPPDD
jgi:hypothetical protein